MKTSSDLTAIWRDLNIPPYEHNGKYEITLIKDESDGLLMIVKDPLQIRGTILINLYNVKITLLDDNIFIVKFNFSDILESDYLKGEHSIMTFENFIMLDIPVFGKRYFYKSKKETDCIWIYKS